MAATQVTMELMRAISAAFNSRDVDRIVAFFAEDAVFYLARGPEPVGQVEPAGLDHVDERVVAQLLVGDVSRQHDQEARRSVGVAQHEVAQVDRAPTRGALPIAIAVDGAAVANRLQRGGRRIARD